MKIYGVTMRYVDGDNAGFIALPPAIQHMRGLKLDRALGWTLGDAGAGSTVPLVGTGDTGRRWALLEAPRH